MKTRLLILLLAALSLGACAKKSSSNGARTVRGGGGGTAAAGQSYGGGVTSCPANTWGMVYDRQISGVQFTQRLIDFTGNTDIGYVESQPGTSNTGVDLYLSARFVNGQFDTANSKIVIRIIDDKAYTLGQMADIPMAGQSGQASQGQFYAVFHDQYGTVSLQGQRDYTNQNMIGGTVTYQNSGGSAQTLGNFWINACTVVGI